MPLKIHHHLWAKYWLVHDQSTDYETKQSRDRQIALALSKEDTAVNQKSINQLIGWYQYILKHSSSLPYFELADKEKHLVEKQLLLYHRIIWFMVFVGIFAGFSLAGTLFFYQGDAPINVINVIFVVVVVQWILILFLILSLLPMSWQENIPGLRWINQLFSQINLGKWAGVIYQWLTTNRINSDDARHRASIIERVIPDKNVLKWQSAIWSQWFSLFLNGALLVGAFYLVTFTDLAFGWSSTLSINAEQFLSWIEWLSIPWQSYLPEASPTLSMVENTRYYRALSGVYQGDVVNNPSQLGSWWPFLMMLIIIFGIVPRLVLLLILSIIYKRVLYRSTINIPGSYALLERMNHALVQTQAITTPEAREDIIALAQDEHHTLKEQSVNVAEPINVPHNTAYVHWGDLAFDVSAYARYINAQEANMLAIGFNEREEEYQQIHEFIKEQKAKHLLVWVKSWEPPTLEIIRRMQGVSAKVPNVSMMMLPYGMKQNKEDLFIVPAELTDMNVWQRSIEQHNLKIKLIYGQ